MHNTYTQCRKNSSFLSSLNLTSQFIKYSVVNKLLIIHHSSFIIHHSTYTQNHQSCFIINRAICRQFILLRSSQSSVLLMSIVLSHLHNAFIINSIFIYISCLIDSTGEASSVKVKEYKSKVSFIHPSIHPSIYPFIHSRELDSNS